MQAPTNKLLPPAFFRPVWLLFAGVLPQLLLLALNFRAYDLVRGELGPTGRQAYGILFGGQSMLLVVLLAAWLYGRSRNRLIELREAVGLLLVHALYLWAICAWSRDLVPPSVAQWMLDDGQLMFAQFALLAPILFYSLLRAAAVGAGRWRSLHDISTSVSVFAGIPLIWFVLSWLSAHLHWHGLFNGAFAAVLFFTSSAIMLLGFLRLLMWLYVTVGQRTSTRLIAALILPLGGLALNVKIPFPCDLQDWRVYALTVLNAVAVCLPGSAVQGRERLAWMARVVTYPFTLYFFLVFLPFLPFSMFALIAAGGGFLILAPTLLFVVHTRRLLEEGSALAAAHGKGPMVALFLALLLVMPGIYTVNALVQRTALHAAIDAVYSPDYASAELPLNRRAAGRALSNLERTKRGFYLPFVSEYYNHVVFNGMTLPDHKITAMRRLLFDQSTPSPRKFNGVGGEEFFTFLLGSTGRNTRWENLRPPSRDVDVSSATTLTTEGPIAHAAVTIAMTNRANLPAECIREFTVPDGVVVSGFWLRIKDERIPGRIFDRKTAEWVYHMIRDQQRRDPGLLQYLDRNHLELRVFPIAPKETRECGVEFTYPTGWKPDIIFEGKPLELGASLDQSTIVLTATEHAASAFVPASVARTLPALHRKPYLHFLIDASASAAQDPPEYAPRIHAAVKQMPEIHEARIEWVNCETIPLVDNLVAPTDIPAILAQATRPDSEGGFWPERAVRHALTQWHAGPEFTTHVPVFVIVSGRDATNFLPVALGPFAKWAPESPEVFALPDVPAWKPQNILMLAAGDNLQPLLADAGGWAVFESTGDVHVVTETSGIAMLPDVITLSPTSLYAHAAEAWALADQTALRPHTADANQMALLTLSRESGILLPTTAYMVVENSAQWRTLERKEKQALKTKGALEFDEFKEPRSVPDTTPTWLLLAGACVMLGLIRKFTSANGNSRDQN